jgi:Dolichyl-phosphate-mannose-protein mannosyltransferase
MGLMSAPIFVVLSCLVWTLVQLLTYPALDGRHDMLENFAWSQLASWGTHKHPPFFSWVVGLWFAWVPHQSTYYKLFAYLNVAIGLWGVLKLAHVLDLDDLGKPAVMLLLWSLPYTTLAAKFNANSQLLSLWPWTAYWLLRSWQGRGWRQFADAVVLGSLGAACMLSKYYSGVFLLSLGGCACCTP